MKADPERGFPPGLAVVGLGSRSWRLGEVRIGWIKFAARSGGVRIDAQGAMESVAGFASEWLFSPAGA